ncbi:D-glucuronyl C5-epimerase family protein [Pseudaminobacter sp. NGMCC 1.201702]|uniref:D-glucuronyl C5-epimerase family protein n=1 Tax=Pseudaminobacter sp. NGMCC 1.201702 TaxID=3391825 RepID=UPI0039F0AFC2
MRYLVAVAVFAALLGSAVYSFSLIASEEQWPEILRPETAPAAVANAHNMWRIEPSNWRAQITEHTATGDYLNSGMDVCAASNYLKPDAEGIFLINVTKGVIKGEDGWFYDPVLLAQCGLKAHGKWLRTNDQNYLNVAIQNGRKLLELQNDVGAFPYSYRWWYYVTNQLLQAGWTSAMAQGQAMSLFVRLYDATKDEAFIAAGKKALAYMLTPTTSGGVMTTLADLDPSLKDYVFFEEIVTQPRDNYILNGYMFALLGLYDWSQVPAQIKADQAIAKNFFDRGIVTLERILPYYDMGGMTAYDLTHFTFNNARNLYLSASYHSVHVYQLHALYTITEARH